MTATHTVPVFDGDAAVLVTPSGEELHFTTRTLALFMDATRMGNDMLDDDAQEQLDPDGAAEDVGEVEDVLEWIEHRTPVVSIDSAGLPMCTGDNPEPIRRDTPAVHQQLRDVLDTMTRPTARRKIKGEMVDVPMTHTRKG